MTKIFFVDAAEEEAYSAGKTAALAGLPCENPHKPADGFLWGFWLRGWIEEKHNSK